MNIGSQICAAGLPLLGACALGACAAHAGADSVASASSGSSAERLAVVLVEADEAFAARDTRLLTAALQRFDALGGRPAEQGGDELRLWRAALPQTAPMRGRTLGPGYRSGRLSAGQSEQIEQVFLSGQRASVAVSAPGGVQLSLQVQDRRDAAVCGKEGNPSHCQWVPTFTDRYRIRIANPGRTDVRYYLVVE